MTSHRHYLLGNKGVHLYNGNPQCDKCKRTYKSEKTLENHKCAYCHGCGKIFSTYQKYIGHTKLCSSKESDQKQCKTENTTIQTTSVLNTQENASSHKQTQELLKDNAFESSKKWLQKVEKNKVHGLETASSKRQVCVNKRAHTSVIENKKHVGSYKHPPSDADNQLDERVRNEGKESINNKTQCGAKKRKQEIENNIEGSSNHTQKIKDTHRQEIANKHTQGCFNKKTSTCVDNPNIDSVNKQLPATKTHGHQTVKFLPIDLNWQLRKCELLGLKLHHGHSLSAQKENIGAPKVLKKIIGDGNCFFRALSFIVSGSESYHPTLRRKVVQHMLQNQDYMRNVLGDRDIQTYMTVSRISTNATWATEIEIFAAAHLLKTNIYVYGKYGENRPWSWLKHSPRMFVSIFLMENCNIYLQNTNENHYDVVMETTVTSVTASSDSIASKMEGNALKELKNQMDLTEKQSVEFPSFNESQDHKGMWMIKDKNRIRMQRKRMIEENRQKENMKRRKTMNKEKNKIRMQQKRKSDENRQRENEQRNKSRDKEKDKLCHQQKRMDDENRQRENEQRNKTRDKEKDKLCHQQKRMDDENRQRENEQRNKSRDKEKDKLCHQQKRMDDENRQRENEQRNKTRDKEKDKLCHQQKRMDDENRQRENEQRNKTRDKEKDKLCHQQKRMDDENRQRENEQRNKTRDKEKDKLCHQQKRMDDENRQRENEQRNKTRDKEKDKLCHQQKRMDDENRQRENEQRNKTRDKEKDKLCHQQKRMDDENRQRENEQRNKTRDKEKDKLCHQQKRMDDENRDEEKELKRKTMDREQEKNHKQIKRSSMEYREAEQLRRKKDISFCEMIEIFHTAVEEGPEYVCECCNQLWYRYSVRLPNFLSSVNSDLIKKCSTREKSVKGKNWICNTCYNSLKQSRIPALSVANIGRFPDIPDCLKLTGLEERLAAARIPFMQLHQLPRGGQLSIHGNVVNVPTNVTSTVSVLPRRMSDDQTIPLKLKRKLQYGHHYQYQTIRPNMVVSAVKWLVENSPLYKEEGITMDDKWMAEYEEHVKTLLQDEEEEMSKTQSDKSSEKSNECSKRSKKSTEKRKEQSEKSLKNKKADEADSDEEWDERQEDDIPAGTLDTMLQGQDLLEESREIMSLAPGEGNHPLNIFIDKYSEVLSFPSVYAGKSRFDDNGPQTKVHYSELCKSELRSRDRRVAGNMPNIFYKMKKLQMNHIRQKAMICLRKNKGHLDITAGELKSPDFVNKLIQHDDGYRVFKELRGSPPYWEQVKKDLFALIRYLGIPTWFASFSSAETRWEHLLKILGKTVEGKTYSSDEVQQLTWLQKSELIKKDPVSCARHFEHQVQALIHKVMFNKLNPIGKVKDFFYKVEFQMRGSPHIHMLIWIENAPNLEDNTNEEVEEFVDEYITCARDEEISDLTCLQEHSHSRTCRKGGAKICRFDFPQPPLDKTLVLEPLPDEMESKEKAKHGKNWNKIQKYLNESKKAGSMPFAEVLKNIEMGEGEDVMDEEDYLLAIRSSLKGKKVFLKRNLNETRINNYNTHLLKAWRANMDLQYVIDAFSCAMYIVSYIAKSQRGMSNLMYNACKEAREGNGDLKKQVYTIGNKFLNNVEISAQEAVYFILQMPLHKASRDVVFINTSPPEHRVVMLKNHSVILGLEDESHDVEAAGIITHYSNRPKCLIDMCLADYASKYKRVRGSVKQDEEEECDDDKQEQEEFTKEEYCLKGGYKLKKRQFNAPLRYVRYNIEKDREDHFREILLLFYPWTVEQNIIGESKSFEEEFQKCALKDKKITEKMEEYKHSSEVLEKAVKDLEDMDEYTLEDGWDKCAPNTQHAEKKDEKEGVKNTFPEFSPTGVMDEIGCELQEEVGGVSGDTGPPDVIADMMQDEEYFKLLRSLNTSQREFFMHILHKMKTDTNPFHIFLTGGAGVGKSVVVTAIHQALLRFLNKGPDKNPDDPKVLLGAPTGIAAFLIKGSTLHSLFHIPANQEFTYKPLTSDVLNTYQCKFRNVKLLIIDEISMVGNKLFNYVNRRLQQIIGTTAVFGGISVLAVGDLYQLKPVFDGWIFKDLESDYGPLATNLWKEHFYSFELYQIMRQKGDEEFANILNRLRKGLHTKGDISILKKQVISKDITNPKYPLQLPHIFTTNNFVRNHNNIVFTMSPPSQQISISALDTVIGDTPTTIKEKVLNSVSKDPAKTMGLLSKLDTAIGQRVEICVNIDVEDGLVNGAVGVVKAVTRTTNSMKPDYIWVEFCQQRVGLRNRNKNKSSYLKGIRKEWTPVAQVKRQFKVGRYKTAQIMRQQFPLRPAAAKTAHRCQGSTMDAVVVDLGDYAFCHSHYVALSRVTSMGNLHLRDLNEKKISVDANVSKEMKRLETERKLDLSGQSIHNKKATFKLLFQNVRSLQKHFGDILADKNYSATDVNIYVETKLNTRDSDERYQLPGYTLVRFDSQLQQFRKPAYGIAVHYQPSLEPLNIKHDAISYGNGCVVEYVVFIIKTYSVTVIALYSSPKTTTAQLQTVLQTIFTQLENSVKMKIILVGDFNIDLLKHPTNRITKYLNNYRQGISSSTTDYDSLLDHLYTDIDSDNLQVNLLESYFSDHKGVVAFLY